MLEKEARGDPPFHYVETPQTREIYQGDGISGVILYLGATVTNDELAKRSGTSADSIYNLTGFRQRQQLTFPGGATHSDVMFSVAIDLITQAARAAKWKLQEIETVIIPSTVTPCNGFADKVVREGLQLENTKGIDIACGCSSTPLALQMLYQDQGQFYGRKTVLAPVEIFTSFVRNHPDEPLFSDVAAALAFIPGENLLIHHAKHQIFPEKAGILKIRTDYRVNPPKGDIIEIREEGRYAQYPPPERYPDFEMNGIGVFLWARRTIGPLIWSVVAETPHALQDFDIIIPHQFNGTAFERVNKRGEVIRPMQESLGVDKPEFFWCSTDIGNAGSASVVIADLKAREAGFTGVGGKRIIAGFGAGPIACIALLEEPR